MARWPRLVAQQALHTLMHEPLLPPPQAGLALAGLPHDLVGADRVGAQQNDPRSPHVFLRAVAIRDDRFKTSAIGDTLTSTVIPVRIPQTRMAASARESAFGLFRQI